MADLTLKGTLNLMGTLTFKPSAGGKLKIGDAGLEALVEVMPGDPPQCTAAPPVILPPPPASPLQPQPTVWIVNSFNKTVKAGSKCLVALGMAMQGQSGAPLWPGMLLPSSGNPTVTVNHVPINVVNDMAVIFLLGRLGRLQRERPDMTALALRIVQPVHDTGYPPGPPIALQGSLTGDSAGLYLKWYSSLNSAASETQPELNADHSPAILNWNAPLAEFGSHVIVLAATDQERTDLSSIKAVTRSAMTGGAPPAAPAPCIVHRLVAQMRTPAANGQVLSKAAATLEFLAPARWARKDPGPPEGWIADSDYQRINGIAMRLHLAPVGPPDPAHSADIPLTLATLPFIRADDKTWFRWVGALPANLGTGNHTLSLSVSGGGATTSAVRQVILAA